MSNSSSLEKNINCSNEHLQFLAQNFLDGLINISNGGYKTSEEYTDNFDPISYKYEYLKLLREDMLEIRYNALLDKISNLSDLREFYNFFIIRGNILKLDYSELLDGPLGDIKEEITHIIIIKGIEIISPKIKYGKYSYIASKLAKTLSRQ